MRLRKYTGPLNRHEAYLNGYFGQVTVVTWRNRKFILDAGTSDSLEFYTDLDDPESLYVLTTNYGLDYVGVERLDHYLNEPNKDNPTYYHTYPTDSYFIQGTEEAKPEGVPLLDMAAHNIIRWIVEGVQ